MIQYETVFILNKHPVRLISLYHIRGVYCWKPKFAAIILKTTNKTLDLHNYTLCDLFYIVYNCEGCHILILMINWIKVVQRQTIPKLIHP